MGDDVLWFLLEVAVMGLGAWGLSCAVAIVVGRRKRL